MAAVGGAILTCVATGADRRTFAAVHKTDFAGGGAIFAGIAAAAELRTVAAGINAAPAFAEEGAVTTSFAV